MRPIYLTISGWGPYRDLVEIDFDKIKETGLFLITGPTGAGKTTIFDAISYALYGNLSGDMREKGTVRSDFADGDTQTFVRLKMEHGGKVYDILRNPEYMRPKKRRSIEAEYTKEKENAILTYPDGKVVEGIKEVNAKLLDILVLDYNQFKQISMLAQGQFSKLLNASSKEKVAIFREIFGTHIFDRFTGVLKSKVRVLEEKEKALKNKLEEALQILADRPLVESCQEGLELRAILDRESIHYASVLKLLTGWQKQIAVQRKDLEAVYIQLGEAYQKLSAKEQEALQLEHKFDQLQKAKENLQKLSMEEKQVENWRSKLIKAMAAFEVRAYEVALHEAKTQLDQLLKQQQQLQIEQNSLQQECAALQMFGQYGPQMEEAIKVQSSVLELSRRIGETEQKISLSEQMLEKARAEYLSLEQKRDAAREAFESADKAYKRGMVGIVATTMLEKGKPCPVCGSLEHPNPATMAAKVPTEAGLEELGDALAKQEDVLSKSHKALLEKQVEKDGLVSEREKLLEEEKNLRLQEEKWRQFLADKQISLQGITLEVLREKQNRFAQMAGLMEAQKAESSRLLQSLKEIEKQTKAKEELFLKSLSEKGFEGVQVYKDSLLSVSAQEQLSEQIRKHQENMAAGKQLLEHLEKELEGKLRPDMTSLSTESAKAKEERENQRLQLQSLGSLLDAVKETKEAIKDKLQAMEKVEAEYGYVKDLEAMASGKNTANLVFEQYVLAGYFDEILRAANLRFSKMTGGRYEMARMEGVEDARRKDSLEIEVMDYYTGKTRPIKTLSGGESFKASLSLALGLSDVIQAMSGGIKVDVLFVDEGFGALDGESLDQACETMQSLVKHNRMIGIISHVQELRERISNQIVVERTNSGSTVKIMN